MSQVNPKRHFEAQLGYFLVFIGIVFACSIPIYYLSITEPFDNQSTSVMATVVELRTDSSVFGKSYYVSYRYDYSDNNRIESYTRENVSIDKKYFDELKVGDGLQARYLDGDPKRSQLTEIESASLSWQYLLFIIIPIFIGVVLIRIRHNERLQGNGEMSEANG